MDVLKMIVELRAERAQIEEAILTIERLAAGTRGKRRGRPPKWISSATTSPAATEAAPKPKRTMSPAARKKIALAQKKRWAAQKAASEPAQ